MYSNEIIAEEYFRHYHSLVDPIKEFLDILDQLEKETIVACTTATVKSCKENLPDSINKNGFCSVISMDCFSAKRSITDIEEQEELNAAAYEQLKRQNFLVDGPDVSAIQAKLHDKS